MSFIDNLGEQMGTGVASGILGMGFGQLMASTNDARQIHQAQGLADIGVNATNRITDYNFDKQMQMWNATNYGPQVQQLEKAGLNPGLLYAKGGPGGSTAIAPGSGSTGGQAQQNPGEMQTAMGIMNQNALIESQRKLMDAQKSNVDADTQNKQAENPNIGKTGQLIDAQTSNVKQQTALATVNTELANIQKYIAGQTKDLTIDQIIQQTRLATQTADKYEISLFIDRATQYSIVDRIKAEGIGAVLQNALTQSGTALNEQQIRESANNILQKWKQIEQQGRSVNVQEGELIIDQEMMKYNLTPSWKKAINSVIGGVSSITHVAGQIGASMIK